MRYTFIFILFFLIQISFGQINPELQQKDLSVVDSIIKLKKNPPEEMERYFRERSSISKNMLGFGWTKLEEELGAGTITIWAEFYCFRDTIKAYVLSAELPKDKKLENEYRSLYAKFLPVTTSEDIFLFRYNEQNILKPLSEFRRKEKSVNILKQILEYMAPTSGDKLYGYGGALQPRYADNRRFFNQLRDKLNKQDVITIMYSINPISRLTAIEYYLEKYRRNEHIDKWIQKVFTEIPIVQTIPGRDVVTYDSSKSLVEQFTKTKFN